MIKVIGKFIYLINFSQRKIIYFVEVGFEIFQMFVPC